MTYCYWYFFRNFIYIVVSLQLQCVNKEITEVHIQVNEDYNENDIITQRPKESK